MIDISVVTGTYNRMRWLQKMVASVRRSFDGVLGVAWEIVVVDGGSQDGTLDWLAGQPDVRLIQHGALRGAVKAFNDGAFASRGRYVVLANDDIEFVDDALPKAWAFMQDHPEAGMGCFFQDRSVDDRPPDPWHVDRQMCVLPTLEPAHLPYGQVCIVPRVLGDKVGWWGDYLRTYGGDNELSSQIYETGYGVLPLYYGARTGVVTRIPLGEVADASCIHDNKPRDALRTINNEGQMGDPKSRGRRYGYHPDSWLYGRRWTQEKWQDENSKRRTQGNKLSGPLIREAPAFPIRVEQRERFAYLPLYEPGWEVQKRQKRGLREALVRVGAVVEVDYAAMSRGQAEREIPKAIRTIRPTVVLCQLHGPDPVGPDQVRAMRDAAPGAWFVNWNGDYWPQNLLSDEGVALARAFDLQLTVNRTALEEYRKIGVNARYWQIGWEPDGVGHGPRPEDRCDMAFLANGYSKARKEFVGRLRALPWTFRLWGNGWPEGWAAGQCVYDFVTACRAYRGARFSIGDSQWPESGFVSNRVMQALAAGGSALCHQWFRGMEDLGLEDGQTCIVWRNFAELRKKLAYYDEREEHRAAIAEAGERLALDRHSFDYRVQELLAMKPRAEEDWR